MKIIELQLNKAGSLWLYIGIITAGLWFGAGCASTPNQIALVPKWEQYEITLTSQGNYQNPVQEAALTAVFTSPTGEKFRVPGFWDGGRTWRIRFAPNLAGKWQWETECPATQDKGLHQIKGEFLCTASKQQDRFVQHGPVIISPDRRYFMHEDGTPFFWLGDTAWNGPLLASDDEWAFYVRTRAQQKFSAVQWVCTQWRAAPQGDREGQLAYTGRERIQINPKFFQRLDRRVETMNRAGLLSVPVLLWAIQGGSQPAINPGVSLPDDQAALLARYMVARWQGRAVVWILNGDGDYRGDKAEKWKRIGRAVFGDIAHAPVTLHPGGRMWVLNEFRDEKWLDICGYQSGHNTSDDNLRWITTGPASKEWKQGPPRPFISLEAPYENHAGTGGKPMSADVVRRAHYWSLLNAPTAGITYGAHGIWGWDDGTKPPTDHPHAGVPLPWQKALFMPGASQMTKLYEFFNSIEFWRLRPAPELLAAQPGTTEPRRFISAAWTEKKDLAVIYVPEDRMVEVRLDALTSGPGSPDLTWVNPRTGERKPGVGLIDATTCKMPTPEPGDWLLLITWAKK